MRKFDTKVQNLKYEALREVARHAYNGELLEHIASIPSDIISGKTPTMRCCIYKERAILAERVRLAAGGDKNNTNVIEVIEIACDDCPAGGWQVFEACRGCLAHRCEVVCPRGAIYFDERNKAHIDKSKCVNCGKCAAVCPYSAIVNLKRPCENACKIKAISMNADGSAKIDNAKCVACGACVYQCPFGAISDKSFILDVIDIIKNSDDNRRHKVYAVVAPSISSQFVYAKLGQVVRGIRELGFHHVVEAALGADMVAYSECEELSRKGFLASSCCPAFTAYVRGQFPRFAESLSENPSPMTTIARYIKESDPSAKVVFIGPCTAKKAERLRPEVRRYVDAALTFEELQALFDSRSFVITSFEEDVLDNASYYGRIFARSGGLADAVAEGLKERGLDNTFSYKPVVCNGIEECRVALLKKQKGVLDGNFIEGMACVGGCINGAGCLTHGDKNKAEVDEYGNEALEKTISDAVKILGFIDTAP